MMDLICWLLIVSFDFLDQDHIDLTQNFSFLIYLQKRQDSQNDLSALFLSEGRSLFDVFVSGIEMITCFLYRLVNIIRV